MKKLLFLLAVGSLAVTVKAQESTSILMRPGARIEAPAGVPVSQALMDKMHEAYLTRMAAQNTGAAKGTSGTYQDWYDLWNQNYLSGTATGYYFAVSSDSNMINNAPGVTTPTNMWTHGMGMSFDPTDSSYFSFASSVNGGALQIAVNYPIMPTGQTYTIDSFYTPVHYERHDPNTTLVDSLIIEMVACTNTAITGADTGGYNLKFNYYAPFVPAAADGTPRFSTMHYNCGEGTHGGLAWENRGAPYNANPYINDAYFDSIFVVKQRYAFALNSTTVADTDANGFLNLGMLPGMFWNGTAAPVAITGLTPGLYSLLLRSPLTLTWRQHCATFVTLKTQTSYTLGTLGSNANWMRLYAGSPLGGGTPAWFAQSSSNPAISYPGSYQSSLIAQNQIRYSDTGWTFPAKAHDVLIPGLAFTSPGFVVTNEAFHITYTGVPSSVSNNTVMPIYKINAYPNPATSELNITYSGGDNAPVTVSLINMVGQVVATQTVTNGKAVFNTGTLANGVYVYSLNANGPRHTGRILIAH
jgi:Secretion system C-terminal sorting domain